MISIKQILFVQLNEFISRKNDFSSISSNNDKLGIIYNDQKKQYNITFVWTSYLSSYYELANVIIAVLSICPSEASVKRSFSIQSNVHSQERNRLSEELVEAEMNIKINLTDMMK
jgi:hypothetical protein